MFQNQHLMLMKSHLTFMKLSPINLHPPLLLTTLHLLPMSPLLQLLTTLLLLMFMNQQLPTLHLQFM